jgi:hypothetical protein
VGAEPEGGAAASDLREVGALTAVADEGRVLATEVFDGEGGAPEEDVGGVGADVLGVAVDAAFVDVDLTATLCLARVLGEGSGSWGEGFGGGPEGESGEEDGGGGEEFAGAGAVEVEELRGEDEGCGAEDEEPGDVAEVLAHADAHGGAEPASDGVEVAGLTASFCDSGGAGEKRGVGYEGYGVEGDSDGIEDGGEDGAVGVEEEEAGGGEGEEGEGEGFGEASAAEEPGGG